MSISSLMTSSPRKSPRASTSSVTHSDATREPELPSMMSYVSDPSERTAESCERCTPSSPSPPPPSPPRMVRNPSLRARVPLSVLEGSRTGPFRRNFARRFLRSLLPRPSVRVEPFTLQGLSSAVFYAPEVGAQADAGPFVPTELSSTVATAENIVYRDSPFEIRVAGMLVANQKSWLPNAAVDNELLMYSTEVDAGAGPGSPGAGAGDAGAALPFIHYDHRTDAYSATERPDTFVPIPASKAFVTGSAGGPGARAQRSVNVQFRILELDAPSEVARASIAQIGELGDLVGKFAAAAPAVGLLAPALGAAGALSKQALDSYAKPDNVMSVDMDFEMAERAPATRARRGEFLRYGYYFFLSEPVEARLYASVRTPKNVQLLLRRSAECKNHRVKEFIPLTDVNYIVVRVCEPITTASTKRSRKPVQMAHAHELEEIFSKSSGDTDPVEIQQMVKALGRNLGMIESDTESESE